MLENICIECAKELGGEWKHAKGVTLDPVMGYCCECDEIKICSHKVHWKFTNKQGNVILSKAELATSNKHAPDHINLKDDSRSDRAKSNKKKTWF